MRGRRIALAAVILALAAAPAAAQGRGRGLGRGRGAAPTTPIAPTATASAPAPTVAIRQFGSWLDDASLLEPERWWTALSFGHYRSVGRHQSDFPIIDAAFGVTRRVQFGVSVPYYRLNFTDGTSLSGLGDVYVNTKVSIIDPATSQNGIGFAVTPLLEVLSQPDPVDGGRLFWAAPVNAEVRKPKYRFYCSGGYFSRGAVFGSGAVEVPLTDRLIVTGALIHTRSLNEDSGADAVGLLKTRTDITGGAAYILTESVAAFGSVGRTLSTLDANGASFMLSGGVSFTFVARVARGRTR